MREPACHTVVMPNVDSSFEQLVCEGVWLVPFLRFNMLLGIIAHDICFRLFPDLVSLSFCSYFTYRNQSLENDQYTEEGSTLILISHREGCVLSESK